MWGHVMADISSGLLAVSRQRMPCADGQRIIFERSLFSRDLTVHCTALERLSDLALNRARGHGQAP